MGRPYDRRVHRNLLARLVARDGRCQDAGHPDHLDPTRDLTVGHRIPVAVGGPTDESNCFAQCRSCNGRDGARRGNAARKPPAPRQIGGNYTTTTPRPAGG